MTPHPETNPLGPLEVVGKQRLELLQRMGHIGPKFRHRPFGAPAEAMPNLRSGVFGGHKQHKGVAWPVRKEQGHSPRLIETGQVPKITVLTEGKLHIGVMLHQRRRRNHSGLPLECIKELLAPLGVIDRHGVCRALVQAVK